MRRWAAYSVLVLVCLVIECVEAHALDRNSTTNKFNWGDDLSETVSSPGAAGGNYETRPPTQLKTSHLPDIKQAIDVSATACSITDDVYAQTDMEAISQIGYPGKPVSSKHVNNLRRAIEELYRKKGQAPPAYLAGDVSPGDLILKRHINDMRRALDDLVVTCSGLPAPTGLCWNAFYSQQYFPVSSAPLPAGSCPNGIVEFPGLPYYSGSNVECAVEGQCAQGDNPPIFCECIMGMGGGAPVGCCDPQGWTVYYKCGACPPPVCGNGVVEIGEECDNSYLNGTCPNPCSNSCQINSCPGCWRPIQDSQIGVCSAASYPPPPGAATGNPCPAVNECTRLNASQPYGFLRCGACSLDVTCGNGSLQAQYGEQCDDGNTLDGDGCSSQCQTQVCGNGVLEPGEQCDSGALNGPCPNHCNAACQVDMCGQNGPCGGPICYACGGDIGTECVRDDLSGTYSNSSCDNACYWDIGAVSG